MDIEVYDAAGFSVVKLNETRLDAALAPEFKERVVQEINSGKKNIVLDISDLTFMDSSSLGVVIGLMKTIGNDGHLVLLGAKGVVADLFKITRMNQVLTLVEDIDAARALF
jgi:anti-sigma B factor antagonist